MRLGKEARGVEDLEAMSRRRSVEAVQEARTRLLLGARCNDIVERRAQLIDGCAFGRLPNRARRLGPSQARLVGPCQCSRWRCGLAPRARELRVELRDLTNARVRWSRRIRAHLRQLALDTPVEQRRNARGARGSDGLGAARGFGGGARVLRAELGLEV